MYMLTRPCPSRSMQNESNTAAGWGLGSELIRRLVEIARIEKIKRLVAEFHSENSAIRHLAHHGGATIQRTPDPACFRVLLDL